mmetsp:Transcript_6336/g.26602  ORF Transcript_6336/g.26602 Transcript_6336/m.26602 type:complete len:307 (+) Transcript_6336:308-1228(+)
MTRLCLWTSATTCAAARSNERSETPDAGQEETPSDARERRRAAVRRAKIQGLRRRPAAPRWGDHRPRHVVGGVASTQAARTVASSSQQPVQRLSEHRRPGFISTRSALAVQRLPTRMFISLVRVEVERPPQFDDQGFGVVLEHHRQFVDDVLGLGAAVEFPGDVVDERRLLLAEVLDELLGDPRPQRRRDDVLARDRVPVDREREERGALGRNALGELAVAFARVVVVSSRPAVRAGRGHRRRGGLSLGVRGGVVLAVVDLLERARLGRRVDAEDVLARASRPLGIRGRRIALWMKAPERRGLLGG